MADFRANIIAILDTSKITKQIKDEIETKNINFEKITINQKNIISQVQEALDSHSFNIKFNTESFVKDINNIIQQQSKGVSNSIGGKITNSGNTQINSTQTSANLNSFGINSGTIDTFAKSLQQINFRSEDINKVTQNLSDMDFQIKRITYSLREDGGISVHIQGLQDLDTATSLTRNYSETGEFLSETNRRITKSIETQLEAEKRIQEQTEKNISAVTKYNSTLDSLKSKYGDSNSAKPITDQSHIQQLNAAYNEVESRIVALNNADEHTFGNLKAEVDASIQRVKDLAVQFQNAEYSANQLAAKPINVIKDNEVQLLREFEANIKSAGINSQDFLSRVNDLHAQLANVGDKQSLTEYLNTLSTLKTEFKVLKAEQKAEQKTAQKDVDLTNEKYKELLSVSKQIKSLSVKIGGLDSEKNYSQISELTSQLDSLKGQYESLKASLEGKLSPKQLNNIKQVATDTENRINELNAELEDTKRKLRDTFQEKINNGNFASEIKELNSQFGNLQSKVNAMGQGSVQTELHDKLNLIEQDLAEVNRLAKLFGDSGSMSTNEFLQNSKALDQVMARVKNTIRIATIETKQYATSMEIATLQNRMETWLEKNTKAIKRYGNSMNELIAKLKQLAAQGNVDKVAFDGLANSFRLIDQEASRAGLKGKSFFDSFKGAFSSITRYVGVSTLLYRSISVIRQGIKGIVDLDTALVDLKKTTDATDTELKQFYYSANDIAKQLGVTTKEVISAAAEWSRLGLTRIVPLCGNI